MSRYLLQEEREEVGRSGVRRSGAGRGGRCAALTTSRWSSLGRGRAFVALVGLALPVVAMSYLAGPAQAALSAVSPTVDAATGYPRWYSDDTSTRLELCIRSSDPCLAGTTVSGTPSTPDNITAESFYAVADARMAGVLGLPGSRLKYRVALEGAFAGSGTPATGQQITFGRINIVGTGLAPNTAYTFTHPFGTASATSDSLGGLKFRDQVGCAAAPCPFSTALGSRFGPFLRWDPAVGPAAPAGFLGDGISAHAVTGGTSGNAFVAAGGGATATTTDFTVAGRIAGLVSDPTSVSFPATPTGGSATRSVTVTNLGTSAAAVTAIAVSGTNASDFAVSGGTCAAGAASLATDATCTVTLTYTPAAAAASSASLTITNTGAHGTLVVPLTGTGTGVGTAPAVSLSPASLTFASQATQTTSPKQTVTLTNSGTATLNVTGVTVTGANAAEFTTSGNTCPTLAAGTSCALSVAFTPTSGGTKTAGLRVASDAASSPDQVGLTGTADAGAAAVSATNDPNTGFPTWYRDTVGTTLQLCIASGDPCVVGTTVSGTPSVPGNIRNESFYYAADALLNVGSGKIKYRAALEAAFAPPGSPAVGQQITFGRINIVGTGLQPATAYTVVHPYGTATVRTDSLGGFRYRIQVGGAALDFTRALSAPIMPFLRWTSGAPAGFIGDAVTPHAVAGSPTGLNAVNVYVGASAAGSPIASQSGFKVAGKLG